MYITELEDRNYELSDDIKRFSEGDIGKYQNKISDMENRLSELEKEMVSLEEEKHNLIAQLQLKGKNIIELEDKNKSITSKLLEMENLELQKEREFHLELENVSSIKLMDIERNYQLKINALIKNLMDKDQELNQIVKSLEERDYSLKQSQNENKSLEAKSEVFNRNMLEAVDKLEEYVEINRNLLKSLEEERKRNTDILKEKLTLEIDFCASQYKINDMDYEIKTLSKQNEKLAIQIEKERTRAKELILEFGTSKELSQT